MHLNLNLDLNLPFWVYLESYGFFFSFLDTALDCVARGFIFYSPPFFISDFLCERGGLCAWWQEFRDWPDRGVK